LSDTWTEYGDTWIRCKNCFACWVWDVYEWSEAEAEAEAERFWANESARFWHERRNERRNE
jgi:hypothetical protein